MTCLGSQGYLVTELGLGLRFGLDDALLIGGQFTFPSKSVLGADFAP